MMGGADKILARGRELHDEGKYLLASEIVNKLVQAEPQNEAAKDLLADIFEQIGYQQENPGLRNSFLAAAYELRSGIPQGETVDSSSPDVIRAMSTELFLNFLGIRMDSRKAEGMRFTDQPDHAGQWREVPGRAGECHAHQHQGLPCPQARSDPHDQSLGSRADNDGCENSRSSDCGRNGKGGRRREYLETARLDHGRLRPALRDHARDEGQGTEVTGYVESGIHGKPDPYEAVPRQTIAE